MPRLLCWALAAQVWQLLTYQSPIHTSSVIVGHSMPHAQSSRRYMFAWLRRITWPVLSSPSHLIHSLSYETPILYPTPQSPDEDNLSVDATFDVCPRPQHWHWWGIACRPRIPRWFGWVTNPSARQWRMKYIWCQTDIHFQQRELWTTLFCHAVSEPHINSISFHCSNCYSCGHCPGPPGPAIRTLPEAERSSPSITTLHMYAYTCKPHPTVVFQ